MASDYDQNDFHEVMFDDFNGGGLDRSIWRSVYAGDYHNGMFSWVEDQVAVGDGELTISTERTEDGWVSGGLSTIPEGQTYGRYEFRAMLEAGQGTTGIALLWPSDNEWTDEVDIMEANTGDRSQFAFVNHGDPEEADYIDIDVSQWHTYTLDWLPDSLTLYVDGEQVAQMTNDVPDQPMSLGFQGQVLSDADEWYGGGPDGSTPDQVDMKVDWVRVSEWAPGEGGDDLSAPDTSDSGTGADSEDDAEFEQAADTGESGSIEEWDSPEPDETWEEEPVDWEALAAQVLAHYEATGSWQM